MGVIQHLQNLDTYILGMELGVDLRMTTKKTCVQKKIRLCAQIC